MQYCPPFWAGTPASHLAQLDAVETKAFMIIKKSPVMKLSLWAYHFHITLQAGWWSLSSIASFLVLHPLPFVLCSPSSPSPGFCRAHTVHQQPPFRDTPRITAHLYSFVALYVFFFMWKQLPHAFQSHYSLQVFKTTVHHRLKSFPIQTHDLFHTN